MEETTNKTTPKKENLDQRLIKMLGRVPLAMIAGLVAGMTFEVFVRAFQYIEFRDFGFEKLMGQIDTIDFVLRPYIYTYLYQGALAGIIIGAASSLATNRFANAFIRGGIGISCGVMVRIILEFAVRLVKDHSIEFALNYVRLAYKLPLISAIIVGLIIGLLPLPKKE